MSNLRPFPALRPKPSLAQQVCTLPYDVMSTAEARQMAEGNPLSFLRVSRPELELPDDTDPYAPIVYERAAENLRKLRDQGVLVEENQPAFYLYRLVMGGHTQTGIVAAASVDEYDNNLILKHEFTRPDKEDDRVRHIETLASQTGPVFLSYKAEPAIDSLVAELTAATPQVDFTAPDGVRHTAWFITTPADQERLRSAFARVPKLYIADGHHRAAAASRVRKTRREANPAHKGTEAYNYFLTVTFPHNQMQIMPYNRVVRDLNGLPAQSVLAELAKLGTLEPATNPSPARKGEVTVFLEGRWHLLRWNSATTAGRAGADGLDVSILQDRVLGPLLGIKDPRKDKRITFVGGIRGTPELEKLVKGGEHAIAFAMFPTSMDDLMAIADGGGIMPPKSTWFEPKLRDAMFCHLI